MASKRGIRRRECEQKKRYRTKDYAEADVLRLERAYAERYHEYPCARCGSWHVGHLPGNNGRLNNVLSKRGGL